MISQLCGAVVYKDARTLIVDVNGVGYKLTVSNDTLANLPADERDVRFWTYLAVRENALDLYGFLDKDGLDFFELLITISGIGPKTAMGILSAATIETLHQGIASGDATLLTKMGGIGKKNAEKIILELKDKIGEMSAEEKGTLAGESDALAALESLGYSERESRDALKKLDKSLTNTSEKVKQALKVLGK